MPESDLNFLQSQFFVFKILLADMEKIHLIKADEKNYHFCEIVYLMLGKKINKKKLFDRSELKKRTRNFILRAGVKRFS